MKKSNIIRLLCGLSIIFLIAQFVILPLIFAEKETQEEELGIGTAKPSLILFLSKCRIYGAPVFLSDPDLLPKIDKWLANPVTDINILLSNKRVVSFGFLDDKWTVERKKVFFGTLQKAGFQVHEVTDLVDFPVKNIYSDNNRVTTHYILTEDVTIIHIVVLYTRPPGFLWHGSLDVAQLQKDLVRETELKPWKHEGAFEKVAVRFTQPPDRLLVPESIKDFLGQVQNSMFTPCNQTRAREFFKSYPQDESAEGKKFTRKARQIVARAKQYLDDLGIPFWLSSGTCLGWFRQCDIITYSKDVDIGIRIQDYKPELIPTFEKGGFFLHLVFGKVSDSYELSFQAGDIKLDLFFFYEEPDHMWNGGTHHLDGQKYKYIFPKFSLSWTVFLDLKVRVPYPALPYIEANYGVNWSEPVKNWEWNKSPPNVRENGFWPKEEWDTVIQIY